MKTLFQIPILLISFLLFSQKVSATGIPVFSGDDVEVWVFNACSANSASGKIDLRINSEDGPFQVIYYDENLNELKNISVKEGNGGEEDLDNLIAGDYRVKVINRNCGIIEIEINVGAISNIEIRADISPICQYGTGRIIPEITGVVEPVTYSWSNGDLTKDIINLDAGSYSLSITDSRGCFKEVDFTLHNSSSPFWFADNLEIIPPSTCSSTDGYIRAWRPSVVTGGVAPLTYLWSNGASTNSIGPVQQGIYTITITGSDGCKGIKEQELLSENAMEIIYDNVIPVCQEMNDGRVEVIADHPATYYCEQLNYISTEGMELNNLYAGTYCISIVSLLDEDCKIDKCYDVNNKIREGNLNVAGTVKKSCPGENNGSIKLHVSGGYSDYGYQVIWENNIGYWTYAGNLAPGDFRVTVTDQCGETSSQSFSVEEWNYAPITHDYNQELIGGIKYIVNNIHGGSGQFSYKWEYSNQNDSWSNYGIVTKDIKSSFLGFLGKRTRFTIKDLITGCEFVKIFECVEFTIDIVPTCPGFAAGSIRLSPKFNNEGIGYLWNNGNTKSSISDLAKGDYYVTITRGNCVLILGPFKVYDTTPVNWNATFSVNDVNDTYQCGYNESCNGGQPKFVGYDKNKHKSRISDMTKAEITEIQDECFKKEIFCPATGTSKTIKRAPIENPDWVNCELDLLCPNTLLAYTSPIPGAIIEKFKLDNNRCEIKQECVILGHKDRFKEGVSTEYEYDPENNRCCPNVNSFKATNVDLPNFFTKLSLDYNEINSWPVVIILFKDNVEKRRFNYILTGGTLLLNVGGLELGDYTISIDMPGFCPDLKTTFKIYQNLPTNSCPYEISLYPNPIAASTEVQLRINSPAAHNAVIKIYDSNNILKDQLDFAIPAGNSSKILGKINYIPGVYFLKIEIPGCGIYELRMFVIFGPGIIQDDDVLKCKSNIIDVTFDSLQNHFTYFYGQFETDSIFGNSLFYDSLQGYHNEFSRHEIEWDWVKHVRYDSTKTVYYFGTDSIMRSFVTSIDTNGISNTTWFHDIIFVSCGPLNLQGIWTLVGYKVSEQKYYMYQFDKVNLTPLPLNIPNDNRGQTYTTVWNFGPDEYTTKIVSGPYEILKFSSSAYPPFEVSLPRPFRIKTVTKWGSNQWLVTGDLKGILVIAGDTLISEEWTKSVFIWYDWTGTVIKYKIIEREEERVITHVATDGYQRIFFTGTEIDTIFHENPDSITIETCFFGDTLTVDGFMQAFRQTPAHITSLAVIGLNDSRLRFYPNPFNQGIHALFDAKQEEEIILTVVGMSGQKLYTKQWYVTPGRNEMYLQDFETLPSGLYTVLVKTSNGEQTVRVVKVE